MTAQEFVALVQAVRFRLGWTLKAVALAEPFMGQPAASVQITLEAWVEDATRADEPRRPLDMASRQVRVVLTESWDQREVDEMTEVEAIQRLWGLIRAADEHEAREWFRVRGQRVLDPHGAR